MARFPLGLILTLVTASALVAACSGGNGGGEDDCGPGESCPCSTDFDCPGYPAEVCDAPFGFEGTCVPASTGDTSSPDTGADVTEEDTVEDTVPDTADDTEPDTSEDTAEDTTNDAPDDVPTDTAEDTVDDTTPDAPEDSSDADTAPDADTVEDTSLDAVDTEVETTDVVEDIDPGESDHGYNGWIAYQADSDVDVSRIYLISADARSGPHAVPAPEGTPATHPRFSPDGQRLFYALSTPEGGVVRELTLSTGAVRDLLADEGFTAVRSPELSSDGSLLLFGGKRAPDDDVWNIFTYSLDFGDVTQLTNVTNADLGSRFVSSGSWSPDGTTIYFVDGVPGEDDDSGADIWSMTSSGGARTKIADFEEPTSSRLEVSPDGLTLLYDSRSTGQPTEWVLATLIRRTYGDIGVDLGCAYYGSTARLVCARHQTSTGAPCTEGTVACVPDIAVIDIETGDTLFSVTRTVDVRESNLAVSRQRYTELPLGL
jgi:Tol biopolymer transport system component